MDVQQFHGEGRVEEGSRCTAASLANPDVSLTESDLSLTRAVSKRLAILGKLAKLDPSGRSTGKLPGSSPRLKCA